MLGSVNVVEEETCIVGFLVGEEVGNSKNRLGARERGLWNVGTDDGVPIGLKDGLHEGCEPEMTLGKVVGRKGDRLGSLEGLT